MSVEKKSLINNMTAAKKAIIASNANTSPVVSSKSFSKPTVAFSKPTVSLSKQGVTLNKRVTVSKTLSKNFSKTLSKKA